MSFEGCGVVGDGATHIGAMRIRNHCQETAAIP